MDVNIKEHKGISPISINRVSDVEIEKVHDVQVTHVKDVEIEKVQKIAPLAAHVKEINNIDPLTIDTFNVSEVRNIDPIKIDKFDVTNIPPVNVTLRQMPPVDLNVRKLPALSVGLNQHFHIPSHYTISGAVLGFELFRVSIAGETTLLPRSSVHRETSRHHSGSAPVTADAGNPSIPYKHHVTFPSNSSSDAQSAFTLPKSAAPSNKPADSHSAT